MKTLKENKLSPKVIINGSAIGYYGTSLSKNSLKIAGRNDFLGILCKKWENAAAEKPFFTRLVLGLE